MTQNHKTTFRAQLPVFLVQLALCAAMLGVYAIIGRLHRAALLGVSVGTAVSLANHIALICSVLQAEKSDTPQKGQLKAQGYFMLRMLLMIAVLVAALKFANADPLATLLPLILMRVSLFIGGLLVKKGDLPE